MTIESTEARDFELRHALTQAEWDTILLALEFLRPDHDALRLIAKLKRRLLR